MSNPETYSDHEPMSDKDRVRLLISDVGGTDGSSFIFTDGEVEEFLVLRKNNVHLAAALALNVLANNNAQVSKKIKLAELEADGPAVAQSLRTLASQYVEEAHEIAGVRVG